LTKICQIEITVWGIIKIGNLLKPQTVNCGERDRDFTVWGYIKTGILM
jgi:hypothetical protein